MDIGANQIFVAAQVNMTTYIDSYHNLHYTPYVNTYLTALSKQLSQNLSSLSLASTGSFNTN